MIIDCISDLHGHYPELEGGDLLIIAGDLTARDIGSEYLNFESWLREQKYKKKIVIAGNHDNYFYTCFKEDLRPVLIDAFGECEYLCDSGTEFEGLKIWGSPWSKTFPNMNPRCKAFTVDTEEELAEKFKLIPEDTDILVTHSPPNGIMDLIGRFTFSGENKLAGSKCLRRKASQISTLKIWVWGHIHESYGCMSYPLFYFSEKFKLNEVICINASHVNERFEPVNKPIRVIL